MHNEKHDRDLPSHDFVSDDPHLKGNERKMMLIVLLTGAMMLVEVTAGYLTSSMALLADGWHMASHAAALFIAFMAYRLARSQEARRRFTFGAGKFIPLGGYTSAIILGMIALLMFTESVQRLVSPVEIEFREAIGVACIGLVVNLLSALILKHDPGHEMEDDYMHAHGHGHEHEHAHEHDHNFKSAYVHVIADAFTSVLAIGALMGGSFYGLSLLDPIVGIVGSLVILKWAWGLCKATGWELLDGHAKAVDRDELKSLLEKAGVSVADLHVWRIAPKATACEIVVHVDKRKGIEFYQELVAERFGIKHLVVEERENRMA